MFMRFATQFGVVDYGTDVEVGSRRGRNELSGLLRGQDMKYLVQDGTRGSRKGPQQKKSGRRQKYY